LRLFILVAREGFLKDKCGPRAKKFEHHCFTRATLITRRSRWYATSLPQVNAKKIPTVCTKLI